MCVCDYAERNGMDQPCPGLSLHQMLVRSLCNLTHHFCTSAELIREPAKKGLEGSPRLPVPSNLGLSANDEVCQYNGKDFPGKKLCLWVLQQKAGAWAGRALPENGVVWRELRCGRGNSLLLPSGEEEEAGEERCRSGRVGEQLPSSHLPGALLHTQQHERSDRLAGHRHGFGSLGAR